MGARDFISGFRQPSHKDDYLHESSAEIKNVFVDLPPLNGFIIDCIVILQKYVFFTREILFLTCGV